MLCTSSIIKRPIIRYLDITTNTLTSNKKVRYSGVTVKNVLFWQCDKMRIRSKKMDSQSQLQVMSNYITLQVQNEISACNLKTDILKYAHK